MQKSKMKKPSYNYYILTIIALLMISCKNSVNPNRDEITNHTSQNNKEKKDGNRGPKVSFTFDDGITTDLGPYAFEDWNMMILSTLEEAKLTSVFFVTGSNKSDVKGKYLLENWSDRGHAIANHTFTHPNFNNKRITIEDFEKELLLTDSIISQYKTFIKLFRFPYLKEGNTEDKISGFRNILRKHGYKNGHVTIDASDWYINSELIQCIKKEGINSPKIEKFKEFYLEHIMERAKYYEKLSYTLNHRHINHTLLLHHNLTSALFLKDLIEKFKDEGWELLNADAAFEDEIFNQTPDIIPAGESLIWSLAKKTGKYDTILRYPAEDSRYEKPKLEKYGL